MCYKLKCAGQYTVDLINNNNISRDVQEEREKEAALGHSRINVKWPG